MKNKLLIILLSFILFSIPCFAYDLDLSSYGMGVLNVDDKYKDYYYVIAKSNNSDNMSYVKFYNNITSCTNSNGSYTVFGYTDSAYYESKTFSSWAFWDSANATINYTDGMRVSSPEFITNSSIVNDYFIEQGRWTPVFIGEGSVIPPQLAPNVGQNLSTESVLSVIVQLIPIILAFLALYLGFWKAWSMLLNLLHKV